MMRKLSDDEDELPEVDETARRTLRAKMCLVNVVAQILKETHLNTLLMGLTQVKTAEKYYCFQARDVAYIHHHQQGRGSGLFFRLYDGRVFDAAGMLQKPDRDLYDTTLH